MSQKRPKYKAKPVYWNAINKLALSDIQLKEYRVNGRLKLPEHVYRFDSTHEWRVYLELVRMYGTKCVARQCPVQIIKPGCCYPKGKKWKVDFTIRFPKTLLYNHWLVEAKGAFLPEFAYTLSNLENNRIDSFYRTVIVFPDKIPKENKVVKALLDSPMAKNLITLKQLQELKQLP